MQLKVHQIRTFDRVVKHSKSLGGGVWANYVFAPPAIHTVTLQFAKSTSHYGVVTVKKERNIIFGLRNIIFSWKFIHLISFYFVYSSGRLTERTVFVG